MGLCRLFSLPILLLVSILILGTTTSGSCYKQYSFVPDDSGIPLGIAPTSDPKTVAFAYGYGGQIYTANGHPMGTVAVPNYPIPPLPVGQFAWNDHIVTSGYYDELMAVVNGTVVLLKDLDPNSTHPTYPRAFSYAPKAGGIIFIASAQGRAGIWLTDGTADGTRLLHELPPTDHPYFLNYWVQEVADLGIFAVMPGGGLYFYDVETDTMYDTPLHVFSAATYFELASTGDKLVIGMQGEPTPLWSSDGTEEGTIPIGSSYVTYTLTSAPGKVYFAASSAEEGVELWQTDGTADHTKMVPHPAIPGPTGSDPRSHTLVVIGHRLYFSALTQDGGYQVHMLRLRS